MPRMGLLRLGHLQFGTHQKRRHANGCKKVGRNPKEIDDYRDIASIVGPYFV